MRLVLHLLTLLHALASDRSHLALENLVLRQQLNVLRRGAKRARLDDSDRVFRVLVHRHLRDWKDHLIIPMGESHLRDVLQHYAEYHSSSRCHLSLERNAPEPRTIEGGTASVRVIAHLGGPHHRYTRAA